ncbi:ArsR/SmtB family transcription factor [Ruegeria atlantica]|nr:metalloregulator ArsR/SmtB family transcription factor [Ruegeria atlantica]
MKESAARASAFLKTLAHEGRLMILCHLADGEKSVGELEALLRIRQAAVSQMLARLRAENIVATRRDGKSIYYSLNNDGAEQVIAVLYDMFCSPDSE